MDAYAARASRADRRITFDRLARARRRGEIDAQEYRLRRQLARRAQTVADLQALLQDVEDYQQGKDHWRFGRWRGPVREGHELEIQRFLGFALVALGIVVLALCVYAVAAIAERVN